MGFIHSYFIYGQISINDETVGVTLHMGTGGGSQYPGFDKYDPK